MRITRLTSIAFILFGMGCSTPQLINDKAMDNRTPFEKNNNYSASYDEAIAYFQHLADTNEKVQMIPAGMTDSGHPLHTVIIGPSTIRDRQMADLAGKNVLLVNNAIHPGEPCGIDASMMLARDLVTREEAQALLRNTVVVIIPVYNISGSLNRGSYSRANQQGPELYGFRGNVRNYDLNRDFIKCDTKNAESFNKIFSAWDPDVFIDNHTSNGADYQYVMTLIATQKDKLSPELSPLLSDHMLPFLYKKMEEKEYEMTPYVYARSTPDEGIAGFLDLPRYSSGYAALRHTFSFMPETHMLKPYEDRVWSTYHFMVSMLEFLDRQGERVKESRKKAKKAVKARTDFPINWGLNFNQVDSLSFKGYEATYVPSKVTGHSRLQYDRSKPYEKKIPFYNHYQVTQEIKAPEYYIIPQAYTAVIDRLLWNDVEIERLPEDTTVQAEIYYIEDLKSPDLPFEGHYLHTEVQVRVEKREMVFRKGDALVRINQDQNRYIIETLEPQAPDSFFAWNFFDAILMQKEYFSGYVFEDLAADLLASDPDLRKELDDKKAADEKFRNNARAQLDFIYKKSPYYEPSHRRYPIARVMN